MRIVPVLDLMGGLVVHGRGGRRDSYAPIRTPLGEARDPAGLAARLVQRAGADTLYIADLDAIMGGRLQQDVLARIAMHNPGLDIWVDGGFAGADAASRLDMRLRPVFGTESLATAPSDLPPESVLSLDFTASGFVGPVAWLDAGRRWPRRVVCMTMAAVGSNAGPDFTTIRSVVARAGDRAVFAAGGVRDAGDLDALEQAGCAGALVATALHDGRIAARY